MDYIVFVAPPNDEDDFEPYYRFFHTVEDAKRYKQTVCDKSDNYCSVQIYKAERIN